MKRNGQGLPVAVKGVLFALIPIFCCVLYAGCQGIAIWEIDPLSSKWNDEPMYYTQIAGIAEYGMPLGYFGYDGSAAELGTLGAWSIFSLLPYVPFVALFHQGPQVMMYTNIFFMCASFAIFYILVRPDFCHCIYLVILFALMPVIWRYALSCMAEPLFLGATLVLAGLAMRMMKEQCRDACFLAFCVITLFLSLSRPYYLIFLLFPLCFLWPRSRAKAILSFFLPLALFTVLYLYLVVKLKSEYFMVLVDTSMFDELRQNGIQAFFMCICQKFAASFDYFFDCVASIRSFSTDSGYRAIGSPYAGVGLCSLIMLVFSVKRICRLRKAVWRDGPFWTALISLIAAAGIVLSIFLIHYVGQWRHLLELLVFLPTLIVMTVLPQRPAKRQSVAVVAVVLLFAHCMLCALDNDREFLLPRFGDDEFSMRPIAEEAATIGQAVNISDNYSRWENTVIYPFGQLSANYLYYLPTGTGIQIVTGEYITGDVDSFEARYILGGKYPDQRETFLSAGFRVIAEGMDYTLYERDTN